MSPVVAGLGLVVLLLVGVLLPVVFDPYGRRVLSEFWRCRRQRDIDTPLGKHRIGDPRG